MDQHLIVTSVSEEVATLRDKEGSSFTMPATWLPRGAREGAAVIISVAGGTRRVSISLELVEGTTVPEGADIGA